MQTGSHAINIANCLLKQMPRQQAVGYLEQVIKDNPKALPFVEALRIVNSQYSKETNMGHKKITEYELCDIGIESSQYFQGFGVSFTKYAECCVGIGDNPREALDDCLEQIAMQGYDAEDLEQRIKAEEGELPTTPSVNAMSEEAEEDEDYSEHYYHVGIRWNA